MGWKEEARRRNALGNAAGMAVLDRYGRQITENCEVALTTPTFGGVMIQSITPVLHPQAAPGTVTIRAFVHFQFVVEKGKPLSDVIRLRTTEELVAAGVIKERAEPLAPGTPDPRD